MLSTNTHQSLSLCVPLRPFAAGGGSISDTFLSRLMYQRRRKGHASYISTGLGTLSPSYILCFFLPFAAPQALRSI